jgi:hypothetical protein
MKDIWQLDTNYSTALLCDGSIDVIHFYPKRMWAGLPSYAFGGHMGDCPSPAAELILKREDYDADYFIWGGCMFVSARMRDAIALDSSEVRYFEVEDSRSAPRARAKNYQIMEPLWYDYIFDEEGSVYWTDSTPPPNEYGPTEIYKLVFFEDAEARHDIVYDSFFATIVLCTDELAVRVLDAGCTGVQFIDPRGLRQADVQRRRTLEGVEVYGEKADPEDYRRMPGNKEKYDWIISRLKEV